MMKIVDTRYCLDKSKKIERISGSIPFNISVNNNLKLIRLIHRHSFRFNLLNSSH